MRRGGCSMQLQVKGRNVSVTEALRTYAERKLAKLDKQLREQTPVEVQLVEEKNPSISANQVAEGTIWLKGHVLHAKAAAPDMKAAIDELDLDRRLLPQLLVELRQLPLCVGAECLS